MKTLFIFLFIFASNAFAEAPRVALPENYKTAYTEYLSLDRVQNHDQFMRIFGNDVAMKGRDDEGKLASGSVIVAEVYSVKKDNDGNVVTSTLNRRIPDQLKLLALMEKRDGFSKSTKSAFDTGEWAFAAYKPNGEVAGKDIEACRACHAPLADKDYLFSIEHLPE